MLCASFTVTAIFAHFPLTICKIMTKGMLTGIISQFISSSKSHKIEWLLPVPSGQTWKWMPRACNVPTDIQSGKSPPQSSETELQKAGHSHWDHSPLFSVTFHTFVLVTVLVIMEREKNGNKWHESNFSFPKLPH